MNMEEHFSEKELKHMSLFIKSFDKRQKGLRKAKLLFPFLIVFFGITSALYLLIAIHIGADCGIDALASFFKEVEPYRTYEGCEVFALQKVGNAFLGIGIIILMTVYEFKNRDDWKCNALLHKCWQLLSSQNIRE